jgi:hypothetical protein
VLSIVLEYKQIWNKRIAVYIFSGKI